MMNKRMPTFRASLSLFISGVTMLALQAQAMTFQFPSIGYHPQGPKIAILEDVPDGEEVSVVVYDTTRRNPKFPVLLGANVFKIEKTQVFQDPNQQGPVTRDILLDFSDFQTPGTYELRIEGTDIKSEPVKISEYLYWDTLKPVVKTFYFQRCGQELEDLGIKLYHAACHLKDAEFINPSVLTLDGENSLDVIGGWHNGSDYAKYVTSVALSAAKLMAMHEWNPKPFKYFRLSYPLFEPGYGQIDDLHHEIKVGLDWIMVMQRRDGAVYRKVAGKQWPGITAPEGDEQPRYLYGISTQDTANAAAALAIAARDFKGPDLGYSIKSLLAAEKAWSFLETHPDMMVQHSDSDYAGSGEFIHPQVKTDVPYRLWAAAELYTVTGKEKYHRYLIQHLNEVPFQPFSWRNPAIQGMIDYLLYAKNQDERTVAALKKGVLNLADSILSASESDIYGIGLSQYGLSSNSEIAERAAVLLAAYRISDEVKYRDAASRMAHYFFGVNPLGITYITGLPGKSVSHPAHRWMEASGKLIPGFVVDGPNEAVSDGKVPKGMGARSYVDSASAKMVNEPKLLNNASLAYLLAVLNDTYNMGSSKEDEPKTPLDFKLAPEKPAKKKAPVKPG